MDRLTITNLKVYCYHGLYSEEQLLGQNFYVTAELFLDTEEAGRKKDLTLSVNYAELCHKITEFMLQQRQDLIESVAHYLAEEIFQYSPLIRELTLKISKPEAPIGLPFENVSVDIHRKWTQVYLAYGSNMGDRERHITFAQEQLQSNSSIRFLEKSSSIVTAPYGGVAQEDYLNGCFSIETLLPPEQLLQVLNRIEGDAGRTRDVHWGPRTLDLDILLYGNEIIHSQNLLIPHYDMQNRRFVLEPLAEIAPYAIHPVYHCYILDLLQALDKK